MQASLQGREERSLFYLLPGFLLLPTMSPSPNGVNVLLLSHSTVWCSTGTVVATAEEGLDWGPRGDLVLG